MGTHSIYCRVLWAGACPVADMALSLASASELAVANQEDQRPKLYSYPQTLSTFE